ncbi:MAG: 50S ribosomal protein L22 [Elusimicrobia bacterium]|nr:50S ribosomal protein L22 [Elusimicrobiota bacterium]
MGYLAKAKYLRVSPKKAARYLNMVRGLEVEMAMAKLEAKKTKTARAIGKLIKAAAAQGSGRLFVRRIFATPGPSIKRLMPRAFGRANVYKRRMSHITVEVEEK